MSALIRRAALGSACVAADLKRLLHAPSPGLLTRLLAAR